MDLSIQIVNYNTKSYLKNCIDDILQDLKNSTISYEILVIDNNSGDDLDDLGAVFQGKVKFFKSERNGGFGAGNNFLAVMGSGKYILVLNPDVKFIEDRTVERLYQRIARDRSIKVIGPECVTQENKIQKWDHGEILGFRAWLAERVGGSYWRPAGSAREVAWVSGAFFLVNREIFQRVGRFDENFFLYKEEEDLHKRIRDSGGKIYYEPSVKVMPYGSVVASKDKFFHKSQEYFLTKHIRYKSIAKIFYWLHRAIGRS